MNLAAVFLPEVVGGGGWWGGEGGGGNRVTVITNVLIFQVFFSSFIEIIDTVSIM